MVSVLSFISALRTGIEPVPVCSCRYQAQKPSIPLPVNKYVRILVCSRRKYLDKENVNLRIDR
jgi:hypothetical protein